MHARLQRAAAAPLPSLLSAGASAGEAAEAEGAGVGTERSEGEATAAVAEWAHALFEWGSFPLQLPGVVRQVRDARRAEMQMP